MRCDQCGARNPEDATWCTQCYAVLVEEQRSPAQPDRGARSTPEVDGDGPVVPVEGLGARPLRVDPADLPPMLQGLADGGRSSSATDASGATGATDATAGTGSTPGTAATGTGTDGAASPPPLPGTDEAQAPVPATGETELLGDGRFRRSAEGLEWACGLCREWNPLERTTCRVCGSGFGSQPGDQEAATPDVQPAVLAGASVLLPGAGHLLLGRTAEGVTRLLLAVVWAAGGLALLSGALASGRPVLPALPLLLGWVVLAVACSNDAMVLGGIKGRVLLEPRVLLWLVVAVVGGTAAGALVGVLQVTGG